ncbi:MAG: hypothetical protein IBJ10_01255 [Phycisphaerales bacterium]|nr:hypothetical protein [Phycisphaerales bacterium]
MTPKLKTVALALAAAVPVLLCVFGAGCMSREQAAGFRAEARAAVEAAAAAVDTLEAQAAAMPEGSPERAALEARIEDFRKDTLSPALEALTRLEVAVSPEGAVDFGALPGVAAPFLPPPIGAVLVAAGPLLAWGVDAWRRTSAAKSLVKSVQKLRSAFPDVDAKFDPANPEGRAAIAMLDATQTPLAKSIVDRVQKQAAARA